MNNEHRRVVAGVAPADYRLPVIRWAAGEAAARGAELHLVTAVPPRAAPEQYLPADAADAVRQEGHAHLAEAARHAEADHPGLIVTTEVAGGPPVDALRNACAHADILVVGADDQSPFAEAITGSVPGSLLTESPCPLVIIPHAETNPAEHASVIAAIDDGDTSRPALTYAFAAANRAGRPLVLLHCRSEERADASTAARSYTLTGLREIYPGIQVTQEDVIGDPTDVLADRSRRAALLVLGSRGHGRLTSTLFGSVSRTLIRRSGCPVVVARTGSIDLARGAMR
jgi:nucleotide-binding universal stress UspA family protein